MLDPVPNAKKVELAKIDAIEQQLDAAVLLFFLDESPAAVLTLAHASWVIARDLLRTDGRVSEHEFEQFVPEAYRKEFWTDVHRPANFLKHADRDRDEVVAFHHQWPAWVLFLAINALIDLGRPMTSRMTNFSIWFWHEYPSVISQEVFQSLPDVAKKSLQEKAMDKIFLRQLIVREIPALRVKS